MQVAAVIEALKKRLQQKPISCEKVLPTAAVRRGGAALRAPWPAPAALVWALAIGVFVVGAGVMLTPHERAVYWLRDLKVYSTAVSTFAAGADPYRSALARHAGGLFFTGPPFVWWLYKRVAESPLRPLVRHGLIAAGLISSAVLPLMQSRLLLGDRPERLALGAAVFFAAFSGAGFIAALAMNNGTVLYALIVAALFPAIARDRWIFFHAAVALATAFKPFYAAFWLVPLLADGISARHLAGCLAGAAAAASAYLVPALAAPALFAEWLHALYKQTLIDGLLGTNVFAAVFQWSIAPGRGLAPYEAQLALSGVLLLASLTLAHTDRPRRTAGLMLTAVFLNPRLMPYDICIAAIPLLACVAGAESALRQGIWAFLLVAGTIGPWAAEAAGFLFPCLAVLALLVAIGYPRPSAAA